jgi:hypothetical protein
MPMEMAKPWLYGNLIPCSSRTAVPMPISLRKNFALTCIVLLKYEAFRRRAEKKILIVSFLGRDLIKKGKRYDKFY